MKYVSLLNMQEKIGTITKDDVNNLSVKEIQSVIFDLTDSLGAKEIDKALEILDNLIYQKEPLQKILIMLYNHFKKIYLYKLAVDLHKDVSEVLGLKSNQSFLINKYGRQSSYFSIDELQNILEEFNELDYNSKIGKIDLDVGLRSILCSL